MNEKTPANQRGQSLVLVAAAMVVLVGFVALAVDLGNAYYARRTAQNAADGAALAGVSEMATGINKNNAKLDDDIDRAMNDFAERNGVEDTDGELADDDNTNVEGYYVDAWGNRLQGEPMVGEQDQNPSTKDDVPEGAYGVEAITHITATAYFGGIFGFDGYPVQARAVALLGEACGSDCIIPVTTHIDFLLEHGPDEGDCFNVWMKDSHLVTETVTPGLLGWVNWTWQYSMCSDPVYGDGRPCPEVDQKENGCDADTLPQNLDPTYCASGFVRVGDWMNSTPGVINADEVRCMLNYYLGIAEEDCPVYEEFPVEHSFTIPVYSTTTLTVHPDVNPVPCNAMSPPYDPYYWLEPDTPKYNDGFHYQVVGFARMQLRGYQLSSGQSTYQPGFDPDVCWSPPFAPEEGFKISAEFIKWVDDIDTSSECYDPSGTLLASPKLSE